jgi:hypothetical protein
VWAVLIEWIGWVCPLTPLENWLRRKGGELGYNVNFIERYIHPLLYPVGLTRFVQLMLGALVLGINLGIYGSLISRRHRSEETVDESNFADQYSDVTNRRAP